MTIRNILAILTLAATNVPALAQSITDGAARVAREARRDARDARQVRVQSRAAISPNPPETDLTLGLAHDSAEDDSRATNTPFTLNYKTVRSENDWWKFQLTGDGYTRLSVPGEPRASGLGDLAFNVFRPLTPNLIGMLGIGIPSHGEVGSSEWAQRAKLIYSADITGAWSYVVIGRVAHQRSSAPDVGSVSQGLYGEIDYNLGGDRTLAVGLSRGHRRGVRGSTELGLEYDFPLVAKKWDAAISVGRGISQGARHTAVELDLTFHF